MPKRKIGSVRRTNGHKVRNKKLRRVDGWQERVARARKGNVEGENH
jgi:hypothetical protein